MGVEDHLVAVFQVPPRLAIRQRERVACRRWSSPAGSRRCPARCRTTCRCRTGRPAAGCSRSTVWCATICATVQYSTSPVARDRRCGAAPASRIAGVSSEHFERDVERAVRLVVPRRTDAAAARDRPPGAAAAGLRNGASASAVTIHGETWCGNSSPGTGRAAAYSQRLDVARRPVVEQAEAGDMLRRLRRSGSACRARCRGRSRRRVPVRSRDCGRDRRSAPASSGACAGRSAGGTGRPTAAPTKRGYDSRPARIYSSAAAGCRAGSSWPPAVAWWMPAKKSV